MPPRRQRRGTPRAARTTGRNMETTVRPPVPETATDRRTKAKGPEIARIREAIRVLWGDRSWQALATAADLDPGTVNKFMNAQRENPEYWTIRSISRALGVTIEELAAERPDDPVTTTERLVRQLESLRMNELLRHASRLTSVALRVAQSARYSTTSPGSTPRPADAAPPGRRRAKRSPPSST
jgi:hypothetical protein